MDVVIYHNPRCGTSRNTLAAIREAGVEPQIVEYLNTPPDRATIRSLVDRAGMSLREALREKEAVFAELDLGDPAKDDEALLDAIEAHPVLLNRPFVVTPLGVRLCRPADRVREILPGAGDPAA